MREPDPDDSRGRRIRLTDKGRKVEDVTWTADANAERKAAEKIGETRMRELHETLADLASQLGL